MLNAAFHDFCHLYSSRFYLDPKGKVVGSSANHKKKKRESEEKFSHWFSFLRYVKPGLAGHFMFAVIAYTGCTSECFIIEALKLSSFREHASV